MSQDPLRASLEGRLPGALALLEALVRQNSFTQNADGGQAVAERLAAEASAIRGLSVELVPSARYAPHVIVRSSRAGQPGSLLLVGHLDTVFPPGVFEGFENDGVLVKGPGVLDMKGGLVLVLEALRSLSETGALGALPLTLVIVSDEEVGSPEGKEVLASVRGGADAALVFEAGRAGDAIITRRRGTGAVEVVAQGKAAHAGNAHREGANAIHALARWLTRAEARTDYARGLTVNVGRVEGGHTRNTVPERAACEVDLRFETGEEALELLRALRVDAEDASREVRGTTLTLSGGVQRLPLERTTSSGALFEAYAACARAVGLGSGESPIVGGGSDANTTSALGIASIDGLGPRGTGFHTKDERFELASFVPKTEALVRFLQARAGA